MSFSATEEESIPAFFSAWTWMMLKLLLTRLARRTTGNADPGKKRKASRRSTPQSLIDEEAECQIGMGLMISAGIVSRAELV